MSRVKNRDSKLEVKFRSALWRKGFRFRKNDANYFGKPDLVLKKYKAAIFIDSCFWHGCKVHGSFPVTNPDFWRSKIVGNIKRDIVVSRHHKNNSWMVLRIWEHELSSKNFEAKLAEVELILKVGQV